MAGKTFATRLTAMQRQRQQLDARIKELEAQVATAKRKADTHRKVVLGALLLKRASESPGPAREEVRDAVRVMSERDRAAFVELGLDWLRDCVSDGGPEDGE